ncbi:MAG: SMC-Scp complex subunit ScpB [Candidatus Paceibacterota bacterium]|jgi:segregation and condensation protein B
MQNNLIQKIEAILFYIAEPVRIDFLAKILEISTEETKQTLNELKRNLDNRGVRLVMHSDEVTLVTAPEYSAIIEKMVKEEREGDLGRAGIETLSIIAYKGPISKKEVEYIRGVNSQYALRTLLLRGLIERKNNETDTRIMSYTVTSDALRFLGLGQVSDLPEYEETRKQLEVVEEKEEVELEELN